MFAAVFRKEIMDQVISPKFLIVFLLCLVLIPPSLLMNYRSYEESLLEYEFLNKEQKTTRTIVRKPSILSSFGIGLERVLPKIVNFEKYKTEPEGTQAENEILSNITGKMDFVGIVSFLLGLFAVLYASTLIVAEKESGTAKQVLANKINRSTFLVGKYAAGYLVLVIPLFVSFLIGLLLLLFNGFPLFSNGNFLHILATFIISLLYLSTFFALGLFISTRTHKSSLALLLSFLTWIFFIFVIPKISEPLATLIRPIQGEEVIKMNKSQITQQIQVEKAKKLTPLFEKYKGDWDEYRKQREPVAKEFEERIDQALEEIDQKAQKEKNFNITLSLLIGRLSPALVYTHSSLNFCKTGLIDRENFWQSIKTHRIQLTDKYFSKMMQDTFLDDKGEPSRVIMLGPGREEIIWPEYTYEFLSFHETLYKTLPDILLLIIFNLILFAGAYFSFIRYDVR